MYIDKLQAVINVILHNFMFALQFIFFFATQLRNTDTFNRCSSSIKMVKTTAAKPKTYSFDLKDMF